MTASEDGQSSLFMSPPSGTCGWCGQAVTDAGVGQQQARLGRVAVGQADTGEHGLHGTLAKTAVAEIDARHAGLGRERNDGRSCLDQVGFR